MAREALQIIRDTELFADWLVKMQKSRQSPNGTQSNGRPSIPKLSSVRKVSQLALEAFFLFFMHEIHGSREEECPQRLLLY